MNYESLLNASTNRFKIVSLKESMKVMDVFYLSKREVSEEIEDVNLIRDLLARKESKLKDPSNIDVRREPRNIVILEVEGDLDECKLTLEHLGLLVNIDDINNKTLIISSGTINAEFFNNIFPSSPPMNNITLPPMNVKKILAKLSSSEASPVKLSPIPTKIEIKRLIYRVLGEIPKSSRLQVKLTDKLYISPDLIYRIPNGKLSVKTDDFYIIPEDSSILEILKLKSGLLSIVVYFNPPKKIVKQAWQSNDLFSKIR